MAIVRNPDVLGQSSFVQLFQNDFWGEPMHHQTSHKSYRPFTVLTFRWNLQVGRWLATVFSSSDFESFDQKAGDRTADDVKSSSDRLHRRLARLARSSAHNDQSELNRYSQQFRLINVVLHSIVVHLLLHLLLNHFRFSSIVSLLAALYFALHPIHSEAIASIVGRADLLTTLFAICTFIIHQRLLRGTCSSVDRIRLSALFAFCASISLLSKETGIVVLPVCFCFSLLDRFNSHSSRPIARKVVRRFDSIQRTPLADHQTTFTISSLSFKSHDLTAFGLPTLTAIVLLAFRVRMLNGQLPIFTRQDNPAAFESNLLYRVLSYMYLATCNLRFLLYPSSLSYDWQMHSIPPIQSLADPRNLISLSVFLSLGSAFLFSFRRIIQSQTQTDRLSLCTAHRLSFAWLFTLFAYLPASHFLVTVGFVLAERTLYMPSVGFSVAIAIGLDQLSRFLNKMQPKEVRVKMEKLAVCLLLIWFSAFSLKLIHRNHQWLTRASLFKSALEVVPNNAKVHYNYANLQKDRLHLQSAISHYKIAIQLWPDYESAHNNLGAILEDRTQAEYHLRQTLRINPFHAKAHFNLANLYSKQNLYDKASVLLQQAIKLNPSFAEPYSRLASIYARKELIEEAGQLHRVALQLQPHHPDLINNYAAYLQQTGQTKQALHMYQTVLQLRPDHSIAADNVKQIVQKLAQQFVSVNQLLANNHVQINRLSTAGWSLLLNQLLISSEFQSIFN